MNCKVCNKDITKHSMENLLECVDDPTAGPHYLQAVAWATNAGFLLARGSDGGYITLMFRGEDSVARTKQGAETIYSHYLTKVKRKPQKSGLFSKKDDGEEPLAPPEDELDGV